MVVGQFLVQQDGYRFSAPVAIIIWRVALKARAGFVRRNLTAWNIEDSTDGVTFTTLLVSTTALLGAATAPNIFLIFQQLQRICITGSILRQVLGLLMLEFKFFNYLHAHNEF